MEEYSLDKLAKLHDSLHKTPKEYTEDGFPMIRVTDVKRGFVSLGETKKVPKEVFLEFSKKHKPIIGDIIFTRVGSYGNSCFVDKNSDFCLGQNTVCITPNVEKVIPYYLYCFLNSSSAKAQIDSFISGSSQPTISLKSIKEIKIKLPKIEQQATISKAILNYDNLIENNNRRIAILEDMAQSLYREWFVDFRYPNHEDNVDSEGKPKLIDSLLGQIPEGWGVKRLDDYVELQRGFDLPKGKRNEEGGVPIYAASGLTGYHDEIKVRGPGIVTGRSGTLGIVKLVLEDHWPLNTSLWVKQFKNCTAHYAYYLLDSIGLERFNSGASVPTLNRNDVHGNPVIAPPNELIEKFEEIASVLHNQINVLRRKNENLKQQRDMLLPKLISGQNILKD